MEEAYPGMPVSAQVVRGRNNKRLKKSSGLLSMIMLSTAGLLVGCGGGDDAAPPSALSATATQSSSIALTSDDRRIVVVNREADSASIIAVRDANGNDTQDMVAEVAVGAEPRYVAISPDDQYAFISNAEDSSISVIDMAQTPPAVTRTIRVGVEPRGIAFTPNGQYALVANHTSGNVSVIDTKRLDVINTVTTGGNPMAVAISNDGDNDDTDEKIHVTRFFAELIDADRPDGFDDAKQGVIDVFSVAQAVDEDAEVDVAQILLKPMTDSGFTNDRRQFCLKTRLALQESGEVNFFNAPNISRNGGGAERLANTTFCPDNDSTDATPESPIANTRQGVYPNLIAALMLRNNTLYAPNIGVQPEPPVFFENNVQGLVSTFDMSNAQDISVNINAQIQLEARPDIEAGSLQRVFASDLVAIAANAAGTDFLLVSRGGSYVLRAGLDAQKQLTINAPANVIRYQTGSMPTGVVMSSDGTRAYTNNEINRSVTAIDLAANTVLTRDIHASAPPAPGTVEHRIEVGKLAFFTALGIPDTLDTENSDAQFDIAIRDIIPAEYRGKASNSGWSSCASCHEDGRSDNVTWIFPTGPVQTVPMEGTFANNDITDQRILNWNGVRGSITDFNNNSRAVQGGRGFATDVNGVDRTSEIFNHGVTEGISDALDAMTAWTTTIRALNMPKPDETFPSRRAADIFQANCASCHGGVKWTKSSILPYQKNPTFAVNPIGAEFVNGPVLPLDQRLSVMASTIVSFVDENVSTEPLTFQDDVGTFTNDQLSIRGAGAVAGQSTLGFPALGATGFNTPSLLGVGYHSPYLHDGSAADLQTVFERHAMSDKNPAKIAEVLSAEEQAILIEFLRSIDDNTPIFASATDNFLQAGGAP